MARLAGRFPSIAVAVVLGGWLLGCGSSADDEETDDVQAGDMLVVNPPLARLEVVNGVEASHTFTVTLVKPSGATYDVSDRATWLVDDPQIGLFSGATFTARGASSGLSPVHASVRARSGSDIASGDAAVEVFVKGNRVGPGAPFNAPDLFGAATVDPALAPEIAYPPDQVIVPPNLGDLEVHWRDSHGHDLYEISLVNDHVDLRLYVGGGATGWGNFTSMEWYAAVHGGKTITVGVRALTQASPQRVGAATSRTAKLSNNDLEGGLYYWAAKATGNSPYGIFRHDFGQPGQPAQPFFTTTEAGRCVACHAVSRDGTRMAVGYDGGNSSSTIVDVASQAPGIPHNTEFWNFATYSPDGGKLVTSRGGTLTVRDGVTGAAAGTIDTGGFATHPDFAATGTALVFTRVTAPGGGSVPSDWAFGGGNIATVSYDPATGTFGAPTPVISGNGNNYYPSFSPDGQWILFNRSTEDAYDDTSAEIWVARADGSNARKLDLANLGPNLTNSWGRWAPFKSQFGPAGAEEELYWITFSSKRDFGVRITNTGLAEAMKTPQIWMSPFFPGRAEAGMDPSAPAFWLPVQAVDTNNHIAQWTERVVPIGRMQTTTLGAPAAPAPEQVAK